MEKYTDCLIKPLRLEWRLVSKKHIDCLTRLLKSQWKTREPRSKSKWNPGLPLQQGSCEHMRWQKVHSLDRQQVICHFIWWDQPGWFWWLVCHQLCSIFFLWKVIKSPIPPKPRPPRRSKTLGATSTLPSSTPQLNMLNPVHPSGLKTWSPMTTRIQVFRLVPRLYHRHFST